VSLVEITGTPEQQFDCLAWSGRQVIPARLVRDKTSKLASIFISLPSYNSIDEFLGRVLKCCARFTGQGELCIAYQIGSEFFCTQLQGELLSIEEAVAKTVSVDKEMFDLAGFRVIFDLSENKGGSEKGTEKKVTQALPSFPQLTVVARKRNSSLYFTPDYTDVQMSHLAQTWQDPQPGTVLVGKESQANSSSLYQRFREQIERCPSGVAVIDGEEQISWKQFDERVRCAAIHLAQELPRLSRVALAIPKSVDLVVATLACNAAGMTAMPLAEDLPLERLQYQLQDADCRLVLGELSEEIEGVSVRSLPTCEPESPCSLQPLSLDEINTVYYTSGSEGQPKGVMLPGRAFYRLVVEADFFDIQEGDVFGYLANPAFDAAALDVWATLLNGLTLVVFGRDTLLDLAQFEAQVKATGVNNGFFTTGLFNRIADLRPSVLNHFRQVFFGGERASAAAVRKAIACCPKTRFIHAYGPTENGVFTTCQDIDESHAKCTEMAIGRPIAGTEIVLVDSQLEPVAKGYVGQLLCLGAGLAVGYINQPALTAEKFISWRGKLAYLSGDLARVNELGEIEFVGRMDAQVKLNGYRIEPSEIETVLCQVPGIERAYVKLDENARQLQAWLTPADGDIEAARTACEQLPKWMRPTQFMALSSLPLNANGKVDQHALRELYGQRQQVKTDVSVSSLQKSVMALYSDILQQPVNQLNASLFELGGNSLHMMTLLSQLRERWSLSISLEVLAVQSTPSQVAKMIELLSWHEKDVEETEEEIWEF